MARILTPDEDEMKKLLERAHPGRATLTVLEVSKLMGVCEKTVRRKVDFRGQGIINVVRLRQILLEKF